MNPEVDDFADVENFLSLLTAALNKPPLRLPFPEEAVGNKRWWAFFRWLEDERGWLIAIDEDNDLELTFWAPLSGDMARNLD